MEGRFNGGFFALPLWGAYLWRGLYTEGHIFGILRYSFNLYIIIIMKNKLLGPKINVLLNRIQKSTISNYSKHRTNIFSITITFRAIIRFNDSNMKILNNLSTRPSVRVHWVACGTCTVPNNFFQGH